MVTRHCIVCKLLLNLASHVSVVHRLDRLTSGLVIIGKNKSVAARIAKQIESHQVSKYYLCKVAGKFHEYVLKFVFYF
jgi:23S rRNA-/tRNA-specific pseudouridylate synthase